MNGLAPLPPRWTGPLVALGVTFLVWVESRPLMGWAYADWVATSAEFRQSLGLAGCFAAACAAWTAATFSSPRLAICPAGSHRRGLALVMNQLGTLSAWTLVGYVLGLAPLVWWTAREATYGGPEPWVILAAVLSLAVFLAGGYLVGVILPPAVAPPIAAALGFAWVTFSGYNGLVTSPVWPFGVDSAYVTPDDVTSVRIALFATVSLLLTGAAAWWLRERDRVWAPVLSWGLAAYLIPVLAIAASADHRARPLVVYGSPSSVCERTETGIEVCVIEARSRLLPPLQTRVEAISRAGGGAVAAVVHQVYDGAVDPEERSGRVQLTLQVEDGSRWQQWATQDLAESIAGLHTCLVQGSASRESAAASSAVAAWLLAEVGQSDGVQLTPDATRMRRALEARSAGEIRAYLRRHLPQIHACQGRAIRSP